MNKTLMVVAAMAFAAAEVVAQNANLKIVVIEGEGAVNIIQQKTAVAPVVEIRDRNNLPVSGATVTFSIGGNSAAFAGGAQTLTVTTNAAGRAVAAALNPLGGGSFQIQVSAAFQGQTAVAAIAQTNVLTIAEAAAAGASGAGGSSGGAVAAGGASGGGGLSGTTIGIIGAAVGGGALAATQVGGLAGGGDKSTRFAGSFSAQMVFSQNSGGTICNYTTALSGTLTVTLDEGDAKGSAEITGTESEIGVSGAPTCSPRGSGAPLALTLQEDVTGGPTALAFTFQGSFTSTGIATVTSGVAWSFTGSLGGGVITGTLTHTTSTDGVGNSGNVITGRGTVAMPVTLR